MFPGCAHAIIQGEVVIGEICHIRAASPGGPRYDLTQSEEDRHAFDNLIIFCPTHHTWVDRDPDLYTVEKLQEMKQGYTPPDLPLSEEDLERASRLLAAPTVQSIGQSGGYTAGTMIFNVGPAPEAPVIPYKPADGTQPSRLSLSQCNCFAAGGEPIAECKSRGTDGFISDLVYWHHYPSAWLRIIPGLNTEFRRSILRELIETNAALLLPFGDAATAQCHSNKQGMAIIGVDDDLPETIATRITQVHHSGEIWGLNRALITRERPGRTPLLEIPWPRMRIEFERTLANYVQFARSVLRLPLPWTVVAGLAMVDGASFVREKSQWYSNPPKAQRCFEPTVWKSWTISSAEPVSELMFEEFYCAVWEACSLNYSSERHAHTWPRPPRWQ